VDERELVQLFASKDRTSEALRGLTGGVSGTHLRTTRLTDASFEALAEGLNDPNPRVRWWCIQVLDHVPDERAVAAVAPLLDDPVPRVRRQAVHALACGACKPGWDGELPEQIAAKLNRLATEDPSAKVRGEASLALLRRG
jgi:hypothetical protein